MTASRIILYLCLSFLGGNFLSSIFEINLIFILGILILGILLISVFWRNKKYVVFGFCVLFLVFGIWRHQSVESRIMNGELGKYNDGDEKITLVGIISKEPDIRPNSVKLTIRSEKITINNQESEVMGNILVTTNRYPEYKYGDELEITGKIKTPSEDIEGFNYREYLLKDGIYSEMSWPKIKPTGENRGSIVYTYLFSIKSRLKESVNKVMSPPQSALLEALFFGDEENFSQEWKDKFNLTGTRHITAVSGMNITIISALIFGFFISIGLWRKHALYLSIILIFLYILMIGAPPSAVRAGIMGAIFLLAQRSGRISDASRAVIFASAGMVFLNPLILRLDVGFQLSFLATLGLIYLQPFFSGILGKIPNFFQLRFTLAATLAAQVFTLPILIYNFGRIPLTGVFANILIVPILPIITIFGFIFSAIGVFFEPLARVLSWPAWLFLTYVTDIIDLFSKNKFASFEISDISWIFPAIFYAILGFLVWRLKERDRLKFLQY